MATELGAGSGTRKAIRRVRAFLIHVFKSTDCLYAHIYYSQLYHYHPWDAYIDVFIPLTLTRYPKQQRLLALKKVSVTEYALPPLYLPFSELGSLQPSKFDVIIIDPPMSSSFSWDTLQELPLASLAADPSFIFLWVGSGAGDGLERGREVLAKWGYRRCEDVCWVKTNRENNRGPGVRQPCSL